RRGERERCIRIAQSIPSLAVFVAVIGAWVQPPTARAILVDDGERPHLFISEDEAYGGGGAGVDGDHPPIGAKSVTILTERHWRAPAQGLGLHAKEDSFVAVSDVEVRPSSVADG